MCACCAERDTAARQSHQSKHSCKERLFLKQATDKGAYGVEEFSKPFVASKTMGHTEGTIQQSIAAQNLRCYTTFV